MNQLSAHELLKIIANDSPETLGVISSLPSMKYDKNFVLSEWKNKININVGVDYRSYDWFAIIDLYHKINPFSPLLKIIYYNKSGNYLCSIATIELIGIQTISELIDVCKDKNFEELLNFI